MCKLWVWTVPLYLVLVSSSSGFGQDTLIFDSHSGPSQNGGLTSANSGEATQISVSRPITISRIAILNQMLGSGNIKFVVLSYPQPQFLYISAPKLFAIDAAGQTTWKESDPLSLTLQPGSDYLVGFVQDVTSNDYIDTVADSMSGITSDLSIGVLLGFSAPTYSHQAFSGVDSSVRLYSAVPEPALTPLMAFSLALLIQRPTPRPRAGR